MNINLHPPQSNETEQNRKQIQNLIDLLISMILWEQPDLLNIYN